MPCGVACLFQTSGTTWASTIRFIISTHRRASTCVCTHISGLSLEHANAYTEFQVATRARSATTGVPALDDPSHAQRQHILSDVLAQLAQAMVQSMPSRMPASTDPTSNANASCLAARLSTSCIQHHAQQKGLLKQAMKASPLLFGDCKGWSNTHEQSLQSQLFQPHTCAQSNASRSNHAVQRTPRCTTMACLLHLQ